MPNETLAEYVSRVMAEKHLSTYEVSRGSRGQLSQTHVSRIRNGDVVSPSVSKLKALAKGLSVPEHELLAVARGLDPGKANLANERLTAIDFLYDNLPRGQKARADFLIEMVEREIERLSIESTGKDEYRMVRSRPIGEITDEKTRKKRTA
jgi:transcriptional regulator with XRE-family HTH domain